MSTVADTDAWLDGQTAASALARRLADGGDLLDLPSPVPLAPGESLHAGIEAQCSWFGPADVSYTHRRLLIFGSTTGLAMSAAASAIGNRRRNRTAATVADPQWRPIGLTNVLLTSSRLLVEIDDELVSLTHVTIIDITESPEHAQLTISFDEGALSVSGSWTRYLAIALAHVTADGSRAFNQR